MDDLERVIRPIVEGQIRGFLKEHPSVVEAVDWYKPRDDKTVTFVNSLAKRIVRDLVCATTRARLAKALDGPATVAPDEVPVECPAAGTGDRGGIAPAPVVLRNHAFTSDEH